MKPLLAPLIKDASLVVFMGLCKNAGKTTAMCRLIEELEGEPLALTSIGRDGEETDLVTGTEKPRIWVPSGTLFATARGLLPLCDATIEVLEITDTLTPLGEVAILRTLSDGYIQLGGPSSVMGLRPLVARFRALGTRRVLLDGAAGRKSLAAAGEGGCAILCVGASMGGSVAQVAAETAHTCTLFAVPQPDSDTLKHALTETQSRFALFTPEGNTLPLEIDGTGQPVWASLPREHCVLWTAGGVTTPMVRTLAQRGAPITVTAPDATHFLADRTATEAFTRRGGTFLVTNKLNIAAICANPWSARGGHLPREELLTALRTCTNLPVVDVKEAAL